MSVTESQYLEYAMQINRLRDREFRLYKNKHDQYFLEDVYRKRLWKLGMPTGDYVERLNNLADSMTSWTKFFRRVK